MQCDIADIGTGLSFSSERSRALATGRTSGPVQANVQNH